MTQSKQSKQSKQSSAVQPNTAPAPVTPKVTGVKRTLSVTTPLAPVPGATPPVLKIPAATGGSPATTTAPSTTASALPTPSLSSVDTAPPTETAPPVPQGFVAVNMRQFYGYHPSKDEVAAVPAALTDLGSFTDYGAKLGILAPSAPAIVNAIVLALTWRAQRTPAEAWAVYVKTQDAVAWKAALTLLDELKPLFLVAVTKDSTLATAYPGLAKLFSVADQAVKQTRATKKKTAKTNAATASAAAAEALATAKATPAAVTPKVITVPV